MIALRIFYVLNIIVAGQIAITAISSPDRGAASTFKSAYQSTEVMKLVGCLWLGIVIVSALAS